MGFLIVNLGEDAAQAANVDGLAREVAGAHHQGQFGQNFLGAAQGEGGEQNTGAASEHSLNGGGEPLDFRSHG